MGKQGAELRWWDQSSSSTVLLDPAALVESCKQQIQGKDGIPAEHQRLIFACRVANQEVLSYTCKRSSRCAGAEENAVSEFLKELRGWEAILKDDNHNIAKLLHPLVRAEEQVAAEDERKASQLSCQTARELRSMGIPCNVYYLFFDKWIPASLKNGKCCEVMRNVEIQIDKDFQARSFEILLFGRLNGSSLPLPFVFRMNGGEVAAQVYGLEQMAQYRQVQKTRHRLGLSTQSVGKGVEGRDVHTAVVENDGLRKRNGCEKSEQVDDYYCPCGKDLDFTVIISNDHQLKCFVLKVIQVPANAGRKQEQISSHVSGRCDRGNSNSQHDSNKYCVSSSGGTSFKCENTITENKAALAESSFPTKCCQFAKTSSSLSRTVSYPSGSCPCPLDVPSPTDSSQSSTSDSGASPQNVYISSTESSPEEGLPIVEEPSGTLSKKKKKRRKGKRKGKLMVETFSILDSIPGVSTINESLDLCSHTAVVECYRGGCETTCCSGSVRDGTLEEVARQLSTCGDKSEGGQVNIFRGEVHCTEDSREDHGSSSMMRNEAMKIGRGYLTAEEIVAKIVSDQKAMALSKESSKDSFGTNAVLRHGEDFLPVGRGKAWSAACLGTGSGSFENNLSQPFVGPIMVEMGFQKSSGLPARSSGDSRGSRYPSRELVGSLETVNDTNSLVDCSDIHFSERGGYNGSSGTGSRNGRSGADGSGNRSHGRGSEDNGNGNTSGYHGGGQGSSGSNHGGGPGGSSTSGSSGGSGGGNWNRGGGGGSSGGSWDSLRSDDDGGNSSKEGDNDERYRNSFQAGSNGDASADSVPRKKGISSLDNRGSSNHGRKGVNGGLTADQLMNGTSSSHGPLATSTSSGKENIESWDDLAQESVPPSQSKIEDRTPRTRTDQKSGPPSSHMNGFLHHELPPKKDSNLMEKRDGVDHYQHGRATTALTQDSFVKVLKQSLTNNSQNKDDDYDHLCSSSSRGSSKENRSSGTAVPPGQQDSLKGAWQKKISWDDQRQQPSYDNNKYVPEGGSSQVGPSKEKLSVKSTRNGIQMRGSQSSDSGIVSNTKSSTAPSTPNGPIHFYDNFADAREFNNNYTRQRDGQVHQSTAIQAVKTASEHQVPQARMQAANTAAVQQPGEVRSAPEESSQRLTTWKSRKPSGSEQEKPVVREKIVGDKERTTHWAQRWVPVEHKSGGAPGKGFGIQSSSGNVGPADDNSTGSRESEPDYVISKETMGIGEESTGGEIPPSSSQSEAPPSSTSPSKSLRRLQTFPSDNINITLRVSAPEAGTYETRESAASLASERPFGHPDQQANLRGLLPRERAVDNPSTQAATQSTAGGHPTPVQSPIPGEQKNKLILDDRSNKGSNSRVMVKPMLSPAEEKSRKVAMAILDAVQSSCRHRKAAEVAVREVGCPMAEFEKVLGAVAPSFFPVVDSSLTTSIFCETESACVSGRAVRSGGHSITCEGDEFSICRCRVSHIPLNSIWQWYKKPSYYGVEVRAVDCNKAQKNGEEDESFLAYFVPYLSGLQIFGYSSYGGSRSVGELVSKKGNVDSPSSAQSKAFSGSDMLATLFPTPGRCDDGSSHVRPSCTTCGDSSFRDSDTSGIQLLYEFYDTDVPQVRQPLFTKVQELVEGVSSINSYSRGRSTVLDELCLGDIHPASWFAVAWYPIYRISEGPLRATFLTYHSFDHFAPRSSLSCLMGGAEDVDDSISMPVVGLECYNLQGEPWLSMGHRFSEEATKVSGRLSVNPAQCLENRISSLEAVAAGMAKGIPDEKSATSADGSSGVSKFRHSDYEFFVKRRR